MADTRQEQWDLDLIAVCKDGKIQNAPSPMQKSAQNNTVHENNPHKSHPHTTKSMAACFSIRKRHITFSCRRSIVVVFFYFLFYVQQASSEGRNISKKIDVKRRRTTQKRWDSEGLHDVSWATCAKNAASSLFCIKSPPVVPKPSFSYNWAAAMKLS